MFHEGPRPEHRTSARGAAWPDWHRPLASSWAACSPKGPGWRWVLFVNPPSRRALLGAIFVLIPANGAVPRWPTSICLGTVLVTGGMLLLVFALVKAPDQGWGSARTIVS
jgi:hypothetical protein